MNKKFIYILSGMVLGGCIGSICSFLYLKKGFEEDEKKLNDDVEKYKRNMCKTCKTREKIVNAINAEVEADFEAHQVAVLDEINKTNKTGKKVDYSAMANGSNKEVADMYNNLASQTVNDIYGRLAEEEHPEDDEPADEDMDDILNAEDFEKEKKIGHGPKIIKASEYGEDPKLDCKQLIYYTDDETLATEEDEIVDDISGLIGDALTKYGFINNNEEDSIYVRNECRGTDYEIIKVHGSYSYYAIN